ncbi:MAG: HEAT repeat domain-containing protein [Planctomycetota bacterium]
MGTLEAAKSFVQNGVPLLLQDALGADEVGKILRNRFDDAAEEWIVANLLKSAIREKPEVLSASLRAVTRFRTPKRITFLLAELSKASPAAQVAILEELRPLRDKSVAKGVLPLLRSPDVDVQIAAHEVLSELEGDAYRAHFVKGLKSPQWEIRALSVDALSKMEEKSLVKLASPLLADPDKRVRVSVVQAFLRRGGAEVIEPLFRALDGSDPRVQDDIADALARLTGQNFGPIRAQWESWWVQAKGRPAAYKAMGAEEFAKLKEEDAQRSKTVYFGLRVLSNNLAFLIDTSESMDEAYTPKAKTKPGEEDSGSQGKTVVVDPKKAKGKTAKKPTTRKIDVAKRELTQVLSALRDGQSLTVLSFNTIVTDFVDTLGSASEEPKLVRLNASSREAVAGFVKGLKPAGLTNLLGAIREAMEYPEVDTIYLLSDGAPTAGVTDYEELLAEVERANRRRRIKINAISFDPKPEERRLLQALSERNFGVYVER